MPQNTDLTPTIDTLAQQPRTASSDAGSVTMPSIADVVLAQQFNAAASAAANNRRRPAGFRLTRIIGPRQCSIPGHGDGNPGCWS